MLLKPTLLLWTQVAIAGASAPALPDPPPPVQAPAGPNAQAPGDAAKPAAPGPAPAGASGSTAPAQAGAAPAPPPVPTPRTAQYLLPPGSEVNPPPASSPAPAQERLYSMTIQNKETDDSLIRLCHAANLPVEFLSPATDMISVAFNQVSLTKALDIICTAGGQRFVLHDGKVTIGMTMDLDFLYPRAGQGNLDAIYRCKHLDADALVQTLAKVLPPTVRITTGPRFKSPTVDEANDPSGLSGGDTMKALSTTDTTFRIHDIILSGPADAVRRGVDLARKFDRPRKQVRIDIRITEIQDNLTQDLGVSWMNGSLTMSATEQVPAPSAAAAAAGASAGTLVPGLRLGTFAHTPLQVNASLTALEQMGKSRTLSNPSLLLLDGERSFILSGKKLLYPKYTGKDQGGQSIYDVGELKVGIYLQVSVQIGMNNDVVMSLMPQVTTSDTFQTYNGGEYPIVNSREAQTTVHAYSGEIVALGGLRSTQDSDEKDGIPWLKDLPFFGRLFSNHNKIRNRSDLVIFLTPRIEDDLDHVEPIPVTVTPAPAPAKT